MRTTATKIILFLDFDGCTHPDPPRLDSVFTCLPRIEEVLRAHTNVFIVISSAWRKRYSLEKLRHRFAHDIVQRVIDVTPMLKRPISPLLPPAAVRQFRQAEIETWLRAHPEWNPSWIAIDDVAHWFEPFSKDLLLTDPRTGFTAADAVQLHQMIKERLDHSCLNPGPGFNGNDKVNVDPETGPGA